MKIVRNRFLPIKGYTAINLLGILFCKPSVKVTPELVLHERIHTAQMIEMLVIGFYLWYVMEWIVRLPMHGRAYSNISFEREAYANMHNADYLKHRKRYAWVSYLRDKPAQRRPEKHQMQV
ncbi:MAG: hypothetical protein IJ196_05465 [Prevotella sp.]|nr:hypothetical protein [Prevotella sp.]